MACRRGAVVVKDLHIAHRSPKRRIEGASLRHPGIANQCQPAVVDFQPMSLKPEREQILENRRRLKTQYGDLFDSIAGILFRHDPAGVNFEVNPDEYEYEAEKILPRLGTCQSVEDVCNVVHDVIAGSFDAGTAGPVGQHSDIACEIWDLWQKFCQPRYGQ